MKCAGIKCPVLVSLRSPVSMMCCISTFTSATSPCRVARIFIASAMFFSSLKFIDHSAAAATDGDLDFAAAGVDLAARLDRCPHNRSRGHFYAGGDERFGAVGELEISNHRVGILVHEYRNRRGAGDIAGHFYRHHSTVFSDIGRLDQNAMALL